MKTKHAFFLAAALCGFLAGANQASAQGTAFTYQGRLAQGGVPASGNFDFRFGLCTNVSSGSPVGNLLTNAAVTVSNGLFTTTLDFNNAFDGTPYWLEIGVRTNGSTNAFTTLSPRQAVTPAPYAITAANLSGTVSAAQVTGALPAGALSGAYPNGVSLTNSNNAFAGNGGGLTNLNATNLAGTIQTTNLPNTLAMKSDVSAATNGLGQMAFQPTNGPVFANATNYNSLVIGINGSATATFLQFKANGENQFFFSGTGMSYLINHSTHSDGEELAILAPRIAFVPGIDGPGGTGAVQEGASGFGTVDGSHALWYLNASKWAIFPSDPLGYGYFKEEAYTWYNGSEQEDYIGHRTEARDTNGGASTTFYYPTFIGKSGYSGPLLNEPAGVPLLEIHGGPNPFDTGIAVHGSFTRDALPVLLTGTNFGLNFDGTNECFIPITGPLMITNVPPLFGRANQSDLVTLFVQTSFAPETMTIPSNWLTNAGFVTNLAGSNTYEINVRRQIVGRATNYYAALQNVFFNPPLLDSNVSAFLGVSGISGASNVLALQNLVLGLKSAGIWSNWDCIYPFMGGTSSSQSWNLANTGLYKITWTPGASTFTTSGWTSDGTAAFGDTGFNPATAGSPQYTVNSATMLVYSGTAFPTGSYFVGDVSFFPTERAGLGVQSSTAFAGDGFNDANSFNASLSENISSTNFIGSFAISRTGPNVTTMYTPAGVFNVDGSASTGVPNGNVYIGARNAGGSAANFLGGRFGMVMIGGGITTPQFLTLSNLVLNFEMALSRQ